MAKVKGLPKLKGKAGTQAMDQSVTPYLEKDTGKDKTALGPSPFAPGINGEPRECFHIIAAKRIRKYEKKLKQIELTEDKQRSGIVLNPEQSQLLESKSRTLQMLQNLQELRDASFNEEEAKRYYMVEFARELAQLLCVGSIVSNLRLESICESDETLASNNELSAVVGKDEKIDNSQYGGASADYTKPATPQNYQAIATLFRRICGLEKQTDLVVGASGGTQEPKDLMEAMHVSASQIMQWLSTSAQNDQGGSFRNVKSAVAFIAKDTSVLYGLKDNARHSISEGCENHLLAAPVPDEASALDISDDLKEVKPLEALEQLEGPFLETQVSKLCNPESGEEGSSLTNQHGEKMLALKGFKAAVYDFPEGANEAYSIVNNLEEKQFITDKALFSPVYYDVDIPALSKNVAPIRFGSIHVSTDHFASNLHKQGTHIENPMHSPEVEGEFWGILPVPPPSASDPVSEKPLIRSEKASTLPFLNSSESSKVLFEAAVSSDTSSIYPGAQSSPHLVSASRLSENLHASLDLGKEPASEILKQSVRSNGVSAEVAPLQQSLSPFNFLVPSVVPTSPSLLKAPFAQTAASESSVKQNTVSSYPAFPPSPYFAKDAVNSDDAYAPLNMDAVSEAHFVDTSEVGVGVEEHELEVSSRTAAVKTSMPATSKNTVSIAFVSVKPTSSAVVNHSEVNWSTATQMSEPVSTGESPALRMMEPPEYLNPPSNYLNSTVSISKHAEEPRSDNTGVKQREESTSLVGSQSMASHLTENARETKDVSQQSPSVPVQKPVTEISKAKGKATAVQLTTADPTPMTAPTDAYEAPSKAPLDSHTAETSESFSHEARDRSIHIPHHMASSYAANGTHTSRRPIGTHALPTAAQKGYARPFSMIAEPYYHQQGLAVNSGNMAVAHDPHHKDHASAQIVAGSNPAFVPSLYESGAQIPHGHGHSTSHPHAAFHVVGPAGAMLHHPSMVVDARHFHVPPIAGTPERIENAYMAQTNLVSSQPSVVTSLNANGRVGNNDSSAAPAVTAYSVSNGVNGFLAGNQSHYLADFEPYDRYLGRLVPVVRGRNGKGRNPTSRGDKQSAKYGKRYSHNFPQQQAPVGYTQHMGGKSPSSLNRGFKAQ